MTVFRCTGAALAALGLFVVGCSSRGPGGSGETAPEYTVLQEVGELLRTAGASGRPPTKVSDLDRHKSMFPRGYEAVKSGSVVVLWSGPMKGEGEAGQNEAVLAYEKDVPTGGGFVLLSAGTVKRMTADEFKSAPKAGKK